MRKNEEPPQRRSIGARRSPATADAVREAAQAVLQEEGYAGFTIEAVARRARAGKPTIYRWWPSKAALLLEVYHHQKRDVVHGDTGDLEEDLFVLLSTLLGHWRRTLSGSIFRSILAEAQADPKALEAVAAYAKERSAHIAEMVERARARGDLDAKAESSVIAELVLSFAWTRLILNQLEISDDELRSVVRSIVRGALKPAGG
ncbi:TetR/AcrR family transcriptional regulator [Chelativorans sp. YIM 93263]|uniref:TetR/AcrR family transcriptional regulator n=1 Tax=Chelativorans sp. YIM 93263 TaxID=2906648 RepID=UPI00237909C8|nr:TetR/AcrR family transcriptional regulator [Chelativorans sp. YIM 93263]